MRVASLTPSNTEIVAFLDRLDDLVARDQFSDWPPEVERLPSLGPDLQIDVDRLAGMDVDLVLAAESVPGMEHVNEKLADAGLDPLVLAPTSLEDIGEDIRTVGRALEAEARARRLAQAMEEAVERVRTRLEGVDPVRVYWEWWPDPPITPGAGGWTDEAIEAAGGINVFGQRDAQSLEVDLDAVRDADPDVVALCWQGTLHRVQSADRVRERDEGAWRELDAVREGRILERPEALYGRPAPRIVEGVRQLAARLHPERGDDLGEAYAWVPDAIKDRLPL